MDCHVVTFLQDANNEGNSQFQNLDKRFQLSQQCWWEFSILWHNPESTSKQLWTFWRIFLPEYSSLWSPRI